MVEQLPPQLVSLLNYVELNKTNWHDKIIQRLIISTIWIGCKDLNVEEIKVGLQDAFSINVDRTTLTRNIDSLCSNGELLRIEQQKYRISDQHLNKFVASLKETEDNEQKAKESFYSSVKQYCPNQDPILAWSAFNQNLLLPLIKNSGARVYELVSASPKEMSNQQGITEYLLLFPAEDRDSMRMALLAFWNPKHSHVRSYVLRRLNAYFFLEACNLSKSSIEYITAAIVEPPSFTILVDTNFVLSILGLHDNPSNDAAKALMDLMHQVGQKVTINLCILPMTVAETKNVLYSHQITLSGIRLNPMLSSAALGSNLDGIAKKYIESNSQTKLPISSEEYFGPYISNLIRILSDKGITLLDVDLTDYKSKAEVMEDIISQKEFLESRVVASRKKRNYESLEHDIIMWHFVNDKRPTIVESPLQAQYWILTVDFHFMGFDTFKLRLLTNPVPICLHPSSLAQLLQFWSPRTAQFEEAMLGSLQLPLFMEEFDPVAERITIKLLHTLSTFENIDQIPQGTLSRIMIDEALRQKINCASDIQQEVALIKEALIDENRLVNEQLKTLRDDKRALQVTVATKDTQIVELNARLDQLEDIQQTNAESTKRKIEISDFIWKVIALGFLVTLIVAFVVPLIITIWVKQYSYWTLFFAIWFVTLFLMVFYIDNKGSKEKYVSQNSTFIRFHGFRKWTYSILGAGLLINILWDLIKKYILHFE